MRAIKPKAQKDHLLTEQLDDELLVYDEQRQFACRLNRTAALVWQASDGNRTVEDLVTVLREELGELADEDLVMVTLDRLDEQGLIESGYPTRDPDSARVSKRRFIRRVGAVGAAAMALPVVQGIVAPAVAAASTCHICKYCPCYYCPCNCSAGHCEGCYDGYCTYCSYCTGGQCGSACVGPSGRVKGSWKRPG